MKGAAGLRVENARLRLALEDIARGYDGYQSYSGTNCADIAKEALREPNPAAVSLGRLGGIARAAKLTPERRSAIAKQGSDAAKAKREGNR